MRRRRAPSTLFVSRKTTFLPYHAGFPGNSQPEPPARRLRRHAGTIPRPNGGESVFTGCQEAADTEENGASLLLPFGWAVFRILQHITGAGRRRACASVRCDRNHRRFAGSGGCLCGVAPPDAPQGIAIAPARPPRVSIARSTSPVQNAALSRKQLPYRPVVVKTAPGAIMMRSPTACS